MLDSTNKISEHGELLTLTTDIIAAYAGNNAVANSDLPAVINGVYRKLSALRAGASAPEVQLTPAVPIRKSVSRSGIICLECGKTFKMLKRHLRTDHGLEPAQYLAKWQLNHDYPLVAPEYHEHRSRLAKKIGLGRKPGSVRPVRSAAT